MSVSLKVLLVEDSEDDALLLVRELRRGGYDPHYERVDTAGDMELALDEQNWDLVIADHSMPAFSSSAALELLRRKGFVDLPFIIVSGYIGENAAVEVMKAGAHDFIMKDNLARLNTAIERELREAEVRRERRRAEEALGVSETRFRLMFEQSPLSVQIFSPDGRTLRVNRAWERLWGVTLDQIPDYNILQDPQLAEKGITPYIEEGFAGRAVAIPPLKYEPEETIPDVSDVPHRWVQGFIYPVEDAGGNVQEVVLIHEDITERMEAEEERRRAEEKYRSIFENAVEGIFQTTVEGRFVTANPALVRMLGYDSPQELLENVSNIADQLYAEPERRVEFGRLVRREGFVRGFEVQAYRKDRSVMWVSVSARAVRDAGGELVGYEGTVEDITERKQSERALREIREAERRRIARELHDVVLQDLTYTLQSLQISRWMPETDRDEEMSRQVGALKRAVEGLREVVYELRLQSAQEQPLVRTLESIVELNRQMAPGCAFELLVDGEFPSTPSGSAGVEVARIVQEALANVRRHSGARRATVTLGTAGEEAWVEIKDDGRGFSPEETAAGMGLTGMHERAAALGGELQVEGERGVGTRVRLRVTLPVLVGEYSNAP